MWIFERKTPSGFSANTTAEQVTQRIDGTGLTAIVTGASSGIGLETARVLALRRVHVIMAVRNTDAGRAVKDAILEEIPAAKVEVMEIDLSAMASVRKFAAEYKATGLPLNILINNAGVATLDFLLSEDNIELHFATNHLGHFLLTNLLLETMKNTSAETHIEGRIVNVSSLAHGIVCHEPVMKNTSAETHIEGRIVNVSSLAHGIVCHEGIRFDKINMDNKFKYGQSKLANILHGAELSRRLKEEGVPITANSLHPGIIVTKIFRHSKFLSGLFNKIGKFACKSVQQGAATTCYVALHPQVKGVSGKYFADCNLSQPSSLARDPELAKKLWDFSLNLTAPPTDVYHC